MTSDIYAIIAGRIREERKKAGLSIEKLAEAAGIGSSFLAYIETSGRKPSLRTIARLAEALKVPIADLVRDVTVGHTSPDYRFIRQFEFLIRDKSPSQKTAILNTVKTLAKEIGKK